MVIAIALSRCVKRHPRRRTATWRGGKGVMGMAKEDDYIEHLVVARPRLPALHLGRQGGAGSRCTSFRSAAGSRRAARSSTSSRFARKSRSGRSSRRASSRRRSTSSSRREGLVKKTRFGEYNTPLKADGIIAIRLREQDELVGVLHSSGKDDILLVSRRGQATRFTEEQVRPMGRATSGVVGMRLRKDDEVIAADIARDDADLLIVTRNGYGKRSLINQYPAKGRGAMGVKTVQLTEARYEARRRNGRARRLPDHAHVDGRAGHPRPRRGIKRLGRATQGVIVMRLKRGEHVSTLAPVIDQTNGAAAVVAEDAPEAEVEQAE